MSYLGSGAPLAVLGFSVAVTVLSVHGVEALPSRVTPCLPLAAPFAINQLFAMDDHVVSPSSGVMKPLQLPRSFFEVSSVMVFLIAFSSVGTRRPCDLIVKRSSCGNRGYELPFLVHDTEPPCLLWVSSKLVLQL